MLRCGNCGDVCIRDNEVPCLCGVILCCDACLEDHQDNECSEDY